MRTSPCPPLNTTAVAAVRRRSYDGYQTKYEESLMATKREVRKNASGGWDVLREGDRRAAVRVETKERALARAREVVRREGGGEVRLVNDAGKIVQSSRVGTGTHGSAPHRRRAA